MRAAPLRRVNEAQWVTHHFTYTTSACNAENENHPPQNIIDYNVWTCSWLFWTKNRKPPRLQWTAKRKDPLWQGHSSKAASVGTCQNTKLQLMLKRVSSIIWRHCSAHIILQMGTKAAMFCVSSCHTSWKHVVPFNICVQLEEPEVGGTVPLQRPRHCKLHQSCFPYINLGFVSCFPSTTEPTIASGVLTSSSLCCHAYFHMLGIKTHHAFLKTGT